MSETLLEVVAAALEDTYGDTDYVELSRPEALRLARAVLEAIRDLPGEPGPRYTAGEYSRRNQQAMVDDALSHCP